MLPSDHVKQNNDAFAIIVTDITNACLAEGTMPTELKRALMHPLLKKPSLCTQPPTAERVVNAIVTSSLDYCNSVIWDFS